MKTYFRRILDLPEAPNQSFFLWGPRQTGKSSLLRLRYPHATRIDLLKSDEYAAFAESPARLRQLVKADPKNLFIIDEVQKIPALLDEVHWLIEETKTRFALCGSSARKLKRGGGNLLGGRAHRYELCGLTREEIGAEFDLVKILNVGNLPSHYLSDDPLSDMEAYVGDYLKEEISAEALVRNLPKFVDFLRASAICDSEIINYTKIGSECGANSATVKNYYSILEDTLLGFFLPAYVKRQKRRVVHAPKFYFTNVGVVNQLAKRRQIEPGSELIGKAFENWLVNEIRTYNLYRKKRWDLSYWRLSGGGEVDLIVNDSEHAIEFKAGTRITSAHLKGLRELRADNPQCKSLHLIKFSGIRERTEDGIDIISAEEFLTELWQGIWD